MKLNDKCCDALGCRNEIQAELNRLNKLLADIMTTVGVTSQNDILAAVRGVITPEWISADLVPPTEPGWYWIWWRGHVSMCELEWIGRHKSPWWNDHFGGYDIPGTRYIKINQPVVK